MGATVSVANMSTHGTTQSPKEFNETDSEFGDSRSSLDGSSYELASLTNAQDEVSKDTPASFTTDPFEPFDRDGPHEHNILTFRAVLVGSMFGALVNASNVYLGLKAGWTTSADIFGVLPVPRKCLHISLTSVSQLAVLQC